jgi:MFS family permease
VVPAVAYVCVARGFAVEERPRIFAIMSTAWVLPSLLAPLAASAVAELVGWRWVFLGLLPVTAVAGLLALVSLRALSAPGGHHAEPTPLGRVLLLVAGAALLLGGLSAVSPWAAVVLVAAGLVVGLPSLRRLLPEGTGRAAPGLPAAVLIRGVLTFAFFSADAYVSLAVTSARGSTTFVAGAALAVGSLTWTVGAWSQARWYPVWGAARIERIAGMVLVAGTLMMPLALLERVPLGVWFVATAVAGLGMGLGYAPLSNVTLAAAEPDREGAASAALQLSDVLGIALGTGVGGAIVSAGNRAGLEPAVALAAVFGMSAAVAVLVVLLAGRLRVADTSASGSVQTGSSAVRSSRS